jgi:DNA-binding FrmR family transcriptional regulator
MAHVLNEKGKVLTRVKRIQGQLASVAQSLEEGKDCGYVLQTLAACRGALTGLTVDILEDHIREHVVPSKRKWTGDNDEAVQETLQVIRSYIK